MASKKPILPTILSNTIGPRHEKSEVDLMTRNSMFAIPADIDRLPTHLIAEADRRIAHIHGPEDALRWKDPQLAAYEAMFIDEQRPVGPQTGAHSLNLGIIHHVSQGVLGTVRRKRDSLIADDEDKGSRHAVKGMAQFYRSLNFRSGFIYFLRHSQTNLPAALPPLCDKPGYRSNGS